MPKSKKPRKAHRPKKVSYGYLPEDIDHIRDAYFQTEYALLEKLPKGIAEEDELMCGLDAINTTIVSLANRRDITKEKRLEAQGVLVAGNNAIAEIIRKSNDDRYIATGDQLKAINEACGVCFPYIDESLRTCPGIYLREWKTMKKFIKYVKPLEEVEGLYVNNVRRTYERTSSAI